MNDHNERSNDYIGDESMGIADGLEHVHQSEIHVLLTLKLAKYISKDTPIIKIG